MLLHSHDASASVRCDIDAAPRVRTRTVHVRRGFATAYGTSRALSAACLLPCLFRVCTADVLLGALSEWG
jgi:hypothetical protein